jgi:AcrR family transcriptional regulator
VLAQPAFARRARYVKAAYMSWSKNGDDNRGEDRHGDRDSRRGYHHGNLREALIRAALDLIAQKGPAGFTFADAARWAGVSSAAPYRHFRDRDALLADVARRGFNLFESALSQAWDDGRPDAYRAFENVGRAYLHFARTEPAYYSAMFEAGVPLDADPGLREASGRAFEVLRRASETLGAQAPLGRRPPSLMMSLHIWALSHGIASLFARGDAGRRPLPMEPEELLEAGVLIYLRGLGLIAEPPRPAS